MTERGKQLHATADEHARAVVTSVGGTG